jgi:D-alanyl-D-alanine dipeptidase
MNLRLALFPPVCVLAVCTLSGTSSLLKMPHQLRAPMSDQSDFTELTTLAPTIQLDIRYATPNNFTKAQIYDCPRCFLRPEVAAALARVQENLAKDGLGLKMFDCYRPAPYQQRLWEKVPNPSYVTPPSKGSMHSRGAAVDLTLVHLKTGKELDMGTPYDYFGREAHVDFTHLPEVVLNNRTKLRQALEAAGFKGIRTEWWHFSHKGKTWPLSNWIWPCD